MSDTHTAAIDRMHPEDLAALVIAGRLKENETTCPAWMESAERRCDKPQAIGLLCKRHHGVAVKRAHRLLEKAAAQRAKDAARDAQRDAQALKDLPEHRKQLAKVEADIARRDPQAPTTDPAAYLGQGSSAARRYHSRLLSDSNVQALARLYPERDRLRAKVAHGERAQAQQTH